MKIDFPIHERAYAEYCPNCKRSDVSFSKRDGLFVCSGCGASLPRLIILDPKIRSWIDDTSTYWHESVGILLVDRQQKILFYELTKFPYGRTVPAGHVDSAESPLDAILRETEEEVGIRPETITSCVERDIHGDSCRRGCDDHRWTLYVARVSDEQKAAVAVDAHEGKKPVWLSIDEVISSKHEMPPAMQTLFDENLDQIIAQIV